MAYYTGYNGAVKEVTEIPSGYNGSICQTNGLYCGYQGAKSLVFGRYRWEKWSIEKIIQYGLDSGVAGSVRGGGSNGSIKFFKSYVIENGVVSGSGGSKSGYDEPSAKEALSNGCKYVKKGCQDNEILLVSSISPLSYPEFLAKGTKYSVIKTGETLEKGETLFGIVQSENQLTYPSNGAKNGFWYVKIK